MSAVASNAPLAATVVICSRNRPRMLLATVDSLLQARRVPNEIVVIDQSERPNQDLSRRGTIRGCALRYVPSSGRGVSRGRNLALRIARNPIVVVLDDDMLALDSSLEALLAPMPPGPTRTVLTGRILAAPPDAVGLGQAAGGLVTRAEPTVFRGRQPEQVVPGPNIAVPRELMLEIGGYDERLGPGTRFPGAEDHDLSLRLLDAGCVVRHIPEAVVLHRSWRSRRQLLRLRWNYARGVGAFYAKHASLTDRHVLGRAVHEITTRSRKAVGSLTSSPATTAAQAVSLAGLLCGIAEWTLRYRLGQALTFRGQ